MKHKRKVMLIGIDAMIPNFVERFISEGMLPNFQKLIKEGCYTHALPSYPTGTGTNWATIATGAEPCVHQCKYWVHYPGMKLDESRNGFSSRVCKAEQIWQTAEKSNKKTILFDYPQSWPINSKNVIHVGEDGRPDPYSHREIAFSMGYSTKPVSPEISDSALNKPVQEITLNRAEGWKGKIKTYRPALESTISVKQERQKWHAWKKSLPVLGPPITFDLLIVDSHGQGYDRILLTITKNVHRAICTLSREKRVGWVQATFSVDGKPTKGAFRLRLLELSHDGQTLRLFRSQVYPISGFAQPHNISKQLLDICGPYIHHPYSWWPLIWGWLNKNRKEDRKAYLEESGYQTRWYAQAAQYLLTKYDWDLFMMKWHGLDHLQHAFWKDIDPACPLHNPEKAEDYWDFVAQYYALGDEMVGKIMEVADDNTIIAVVSDHGFIASMKFVDVDRAYEKAGLLARDSDDSINWSKTKAFQGYVNLKGREPTGIVNLEEYEKIREKMITTLTEIKDPQTGIPAVSFAWKKEDAICLGQGGDIAPDVVYGFNPPRQETSSPKRKKDDVVIDSYKTGGGLWGVSSGTHGPFLPSTTFSVGTLNAVFFASGPGLRQGYKRELPIHLRDIAPTIAHILDIPRPAQAQGTILTDIFEKK